MTWLWVALAGAIGTALRYGANVWLLAALGGRWPYGTFVANLTGSFALGVVMDLASGRLIGGADARLVLGTGLLGGYTTYSSFNLETIRLAEQGAWGRAALYVAATMVSCLLAGVAGVALARAVRGGS